MATKNATRNPLIDDSPLDTLENIQAVLAFLQHQHAGEWGYEPGDRVTMGQMIVFRAVEGAVESLEPHLRRALEASREARHG